MAKSVKNAWTILCGEASETGVIATLAPKLLASALMLAVHRTRHTWEREVDILCRPHGVCPEEVSGGRAACGEDIRQT